jgi:hypothetical protein
MPRVIKVIISEDGFVYTFDGEPIATTHIGPSPAKRGRPPKRTTPPQEPVDLGSFFGPPAAAEAPSLTEEAMREYVKAVNTGVLNAETFDPHDEFRSGTGLT